jgi:hypothetical protein
MLSDELYLIIKIIIFMIIVTLMIIAVFFLIKIGELSTLASKESIDSLYDRIGYGDVLQLRLSTWYGRMFVTTVNTFFHHAIVVKLPNDHNKYIFHTRNKGIKPVLHPELEHNTKKMGYKNTYQLVELREYLNYIARKEEYITHLKSHKNIDYTMNVKDTMSLPLWSKYYFHCGYLMLNFMRKNRWTNQELPSAYDSAYYITQSITERLIDIDQYTYEGIFIPERMDYSEVPN